MKESEVKEGQLYREKGDVKFPRVVRIRKVEKIGPRDYVYIEAQNQAAMAAHPNGGFLPLESFFTVWIPYQEASQNSS